jgi:hypothetical protein
MKDWFNSATLVDDASVEIGFLLHPDFYYGPDRHTDIAERKLIEPLCVPAFPRAAERLATTKEAENHTGELIRYYADVVRLSRKHGKSFEQIRLYFWLRLFICDPSGNFNVSFPWYDTLSEMEGLLNILSDPPSTGEVHWDRDQCWELEMDAHGGMLYVREWDPDYEEIHVVGKLPLLSLASSSKAALDRARQIIATLTTALTEDAWTKHKTAVDFSRLSFPIHA